MTFAGETRLLLRCFWCKKWSKQSLLLHAVLLALFSPSFRCTEWMTFTGRAPHTSPQRHCQNRDFPALFTGCPFVVDCLNIDIVICLLTATWQIEHSRDISSFLECQNRVSVCVCAVGGAGALADDSVWCRAAIDTRRTTAVWTLNKVIIIDSSHSVGQHLCGKCRQSRKNILFRSFARRCGQHLGCVQVAASIGTFALDTL